jgi:hypothetical protein
MFKFTKTQILHLISALVIVPAAGVISAWSMRYLPGSLHLTASDITTVATATTASAFGIVLHWLHGNLWFEKNVAPIVDIQDKAKPPPA